MSNGSYQTHSWSLNLLRINRKVNLWTTNNPQSTTVTSNLNVEPLIIHSTQQDFQSQSNPMNRCIQVGQKWFPNLNLWPDLILTFVCMYLSLFESVKRKTETHDYRTLKCTLVTFQPGSSPFFSFPFNFLKFFSWCGSYYIYITKKSWSHIDRGCTII